MDGKNTNIKQKRSDETAVRASPPYPSISVSERNVSYAQLLSADLAGPRSEMTSICQYTYQSWAISSRYPAMAETIAAIAKVEMHHLNILGQLIVRLGGNPKLQYIQNRRAFAWNSGHVNYTQSITDFFKANIAAEQYAAEMYMQHAKRIQDGDVSEMLARISLDEAQHKSIFERFLAEVNTEERL